MVLMLPAAGRVAVPWKNGGGQTTEIAVEPPASTFDTFDWRVSMAQVSTAGPFSLFPGIDRELAVLDGCLRLGIEGGGTCTLTPDSDPVRFAGDVRVHGEPLAGSVTDLNVMMRRGRCRARLERRQLPAPTALEPGPGTTLVLAVSALLLDADAQPFALPGAGNRKHDVGFASSKISGE